MWIQHIAGNLLGRSMIRKNQLNRDKSPLNFHHRKSRKTLLSISIKKKKSLVLLSFLMLVFHSVRQQKIQQTEEAGRKPKQLYFQIQLALLSTKNPQHI